MIKSTYIPDPKTDDQESGEPVPSGFEILLKFIHIIVVRKKMILGVTFIGTLISIIAVLVWPSTYRSIGIIKPPTTDGAGPMDALMDQAGPLAGMLGSFISKASGANDCLSILGSVQFARIVIDKFDLETLYKFKGKGKKYYFANVLKAYRLNTGYQVTDEDAIIISMEDKSPERARDIVAFMIYALDSIYTDIQKKTIQQKLGYIDNRVELAEREMNQLEDSLVIFQKKYNLYLPEVQVEAILGNVVQMESQIEILKQSMDLEAALRGRSSDKFRSLQVEKALLERKLQGKFTGAMDSSSLAFPVRVLPNLATEFFRLERAYKVKLTLYKYLIQQLEGLRLEAEKNIKVISVLDPPWVNDKRVAPLRRLIVQMVFVFLLIFSSLLAVVLTLWEKHKKEKTGTHQLVTRIRENIFKL